MKFSKLILVFTTFFVLVSCATNQPSNSDTLLSRLQQGGYVIFFRHGATDFSQKDTDKKNLENCQTQRRLSSKGRQQAAMIGEGFKAKGIPVGDVITSYYCRCINTAKIAFGKATPSMDITSIQGVPLDVRQQRISNLRKMLNTPAKPGTNTILVAHQWMFKDAAGHRLIEGEAAIFKPQSNAVVARFIKRIKPEEWQGLN